MVSPFQEVKTYADSNQFRFVCPIFGAETKITHCLELRERVWAGRQPEQRKGCQACMKSSKCPIVHIMREIQHKGTDPYFAREAKVGKLNSNHLNSILCISIPEREMHEVGVPEKEVALIRTSNARITSQLGKAATDGDVDYSPSEEERDLAPKPRRRASAKPSVAPTRELSAAERGDMSAAINEAMKEEAA